MMKKQTALLTSDEISKKMDAMVQERQRQEAEFRRQWPSSNQSASLQFQTVTEKPLTSDEISDKMNTMIQERKRQNAEFQKLNTNVTKK